MSHILLGGSSVDEDVSLALKMANRHGLVAGATGTGKTVTLQVLAEGFSRAGVPVFTADVKGDLSGIAKEASPHPKIQERIDKIGIENYTSRGYPVAFWDLFGENGIPIRTTVSEMGPLLLSRLFDLSDAQEGVMHAAFHIADEEGLLLLDLKDLRSLLAWMSENSKELRSEYGNISSRSVGAMQRDILAISDAGGDLFFGEPALKLEHIMQHDFSGNGVISILDAQKLMSDPRIYSTFLLWLLSELFEQLEEVGDDEKPRLVFFFDEAHLLFDHTPKALLEKVEQVVKLIRSKGVGVYFVTQNPADIPDSVLAQLGNRIQHALRAFTPKERKAVKVAAQSFRENPDIDTETMITELGIGEALISTLDEKGEPTIVQHTLVVPPESRIGPISDEEREEIMKRSPLKGSYEEAIDRESAFEILKEREEEREKQESEDLKKERKKKGSNRQSVTESFFKSVARSIGYQVGKQILRGVLGSIRLK